MSRSLVATSSTALSCSDTGFPTGQTARTVGFWFKTATHLTGGAVGSMVSYGGTGTGDGLVLGVIDSGGQTIPFVSQFGSLVTVTTAVDDNKWHNLICSVNDQFGSNHWVLNLDLYRSSSSNSGFMGTNTTLGGSFYVGRDPLNPAFCTAEIAEVAAWNVLLGSNEAIAFAAGINPIRIRPLSLIGYWPLLGLQSTEPDLSGNKRALTLSNSPVKGPSHSPTVSFTRQAN